MNDLHLDKNTWKWNLSLSSFAKVVNFRGRTEMSHYSSSFSSTIQAIMLISEKFEGKNNLNWWITYLL